MSNENQNNSHDEEKKLTGHSYDGITELDNPLPSWWLWTFLFTIIFAFIYYIHYELGGGPSLNQELAHAMQEIEKNKKNEPVLLETEEGLQASMSKDGILNIGSAAYAEKCAACHGVELQGTIGPNLVDKYWLHGKGTRVDVIAVIRNGVLDKGMPNWGTMLTQDELYAVTAFILSKANTNPAGAKAPQGELVE